MTAVPRASRVTGALALGALAFAALPQAAQAQQAPIQAQTTPVAPPLSSVSPRGAFLRALALPGWGHAAIGAHARGGFYFGAEAATAFTLIRTRQKLNEARRRLSFREQIVRTQLATEGVTDFDEIETRLQDDPAVAELRSLRDSRGEQQEDMVALGIFILFLSGADAYVSAHLSRFPEPLEVEAEPVGNGRMSLALKLRFR